MASLQQQVYESEYKQIKPKIGIDHKVEKIYLVLVCIKQNLFQKQQIDFKM